MKEFRYIGTHAENLDSGRPIEPGEYTGPISTAKSGVNKTLEAEGLLIEVPDGTADKVAELDRLAANEEPDGDTADDTEDEQ